MALINFRNTYLLLLMFFGVACANATLERTPEEFESQETPPKQETPSKNDDRSDTPFHFRSVNFSADSIEFRPTVKVVLVIDNSHSMRDEQQILAEGVGKMLDGLFDKKYNVEFLLYTTTSDSQDLLEEGASSVQVAQIKPVAEKKSFYRVLDPNEGPLKVATPPESSDPRDYQSVQSFDLLSPIRGETDLKLTNDMGSASYAQIRQNLINQVSEIGTTGSDKESGLCSLGRILSEGGPEAVLKLGDKVAYVIISDMDDDSEETSCTKEIIDNFTFDAENTATQNTNQHAEAFRWDYRNMTFKLPDGQTVANYDFEYQEDRTQAKYFYRHAYSKYQYTRITQNARLRYKYTTPIIIDNQVRGHNETLESLSLEPSSLNDVSRTTRYAPCSASLDLQARADTPSNGDYVEGSCEYIFLDENRTSGDIEFDFHDFPGLEAPENPNHFIACPSGMIALAQQDALSHGATYAPNSCRYRYIPNHGIKEISFSKATFNNLATTNPNGTREACPSQIVERLKLDRAKQGHLYLDGSCQYEYYDWVATIRTHQRNFDPSAYDLTMTNNNTSCKEVDPNLEATAKSMTPQGRRYVEGSCHYRWFLQDRYSSCGTYTDLISPTVDACVSPITINNQTYTNYEAYCRTKRGLNDSWIATNSCGGSGKKRVADPEHDFINTKTTLVHQALKPEAENLEEGIISKSTELFGGDGFFLSAIIDDPLFDNSSDNLCQSEAAAVNFTTQNYRLFVDSLEDKGNLHNICSNDYFPALAKVNEFIEKSVANSYSIKLSDLEEIYQVMIVRDDVEITLAPTTDYQIVGGSLNFVEGILDKNDELRIGVRKPQ